MRDAMNVVLGSSLADGPFALLGDKPKIAIWPLEL